MLDGVTRGGRGTVGGSVKDKVGVRVRGGILYFQRLINNNEGIVSRAGPPRGFREASQGEAHLFFPKYNAASTGIAASPRDQSTTSLGTDQRTHEPGPSFLAPAF